MTIVKKLIKKYKKLLKKKVPLSVLVIVSAVTVLLLLSTIASILYIVRYKKAVLNTSTAPLPILDAIGKQMTLPNESPTIATVSDPAKLQTQPFFHDAQSGDKVIIYRTAAEVILYRPSTNVVIAVAPLTDQ